MSAYRLRVEKVVGSLPGTLTSNTLYILRTGVGVDFCITDSTGAVAYKQNGSTWDSITGTFPNDIVSNSKLANMPTMTIKGNNTGSTGDPVDLTASQIRTVAGLGTSATVAVGTSGATIPLNNGGNTWSATNTFSSGAMIIEMVNDTASTGVNLTCRRARVGLAAVSSGDAICSIFFAAHNGSTYANPALIGVSATENHTTTAAGAQITFATVMTGADPTTRTSRHGIDGTAAWRPYADNVYNYGAPAFRIKDSYFGNAPTVTSDAREKTNVTPLTVEALRCAAELTSSIGWFKWLTAVAEKGDAARKHVGLTVQHVIEILSLAGLNPFEFGFICYDRWDAEYEPVMRERSIVDDFGDEIIFTEPTGEMRCTLEAGDRYSLRDGEFNKFLLAGMAWKMKNLEDSVQRLNKAVFNE